MKIASFTMMKNEAAILNPFLDQLSTFFDHSIIVDHGSVDVSTSIVRARNEARIELLHLKARGYPQSRLATVMMNRIFESTSADWLIFLDCDEFLPFDTRADLEAALTEKGTEGYCHLRWANIVPLDLNGGNIFAGELKYRGSLSPFPKIMVSRALFERHKDLQVLQGYHACASGSALPQPRELSSVGLYHLPVTSKLRFAAKVKNSGKQVMADRMLVAKGLGFHWINHYIDLTSQPFDNYDFHSVGLSYPGNDKIDVNSAESVDFKFPYIRTPYEEKAADLVMLLYRESQAATPSTAYVLHDDAGTIISSQTADDSLTTADDTTARAERRNRESVLDQMSTGQTFSDIIEPLFSLPMKLPPTAWAGHIPFLMTLIKLMEPRTYVELGTHYGASLIGAATASKSFNVPMKLYGVDSWEGDVHAGVYEGEPIYQQLKDYISQRFQNVELVRAYFDDANPRFASGSIDILHIDGLHTYDAVKHDFVSWLPKMAPDGVILFHDTCVYERGFGVFQLWEELRNQFTTLSFGHSFGLGVVFLDASSPRVASLGRIAQNQDTAQAYVALVAQIGNILHPRMHYLELQEHGRGSEQDAWNQLAALRQHSGYLESNVRRLEEALAALEKNSEAHLEALRASAIQLEFYRQQLGMMETLNEQVTNHEIEREDHFRALRESAVELNFYRQQSRMMETLDRQVADYEIEREDHLRALRESAVELEFYRQQLSVIGALTEQITGYEKEREDHLRAVHELAIELNFYRQQSRLASIGGRR